MIEIIVFIIIIAVVIKNSKKKSQPRQTPPFTAGQKKPLRRQKPEAPLPASSKADEPMEGRTFIEPAKPYRPAYNAGERYEEWMPVPEGKRVCHCGYCGADNLIPKHSDPKNFTCYFCREEL